ncbi:GlxA family transcriptional regulator [Pseudoalteromonas aurantia]|uniref:HTH araC/xylS-type domain-containing protein n=1 Tax=Pseudoalteromonas aurantia 208 TaxID=1314867 RepID=A0ABR9EAW9_9GAMM|nr:helix-turn-helix domain-containing protein [Pseudoalteromonas aurantia]MBE0368113.1 hypothetical protein [Pseudoalteromonas aurantia 208]
MKVSIIIPDNVLASGLMGVIDVLHVANTLARRPIFEWQLVSLTTDTVHASQGMVFESCTPLAGIQSCDAMIWVGSQYLGQQALWQQCQQIAPLKLHITKLIEQSEVVLAGCTGVSYLAKSGVLNDIKLTSSWWLKTFYAKYFPHLNVSQEAIYIHDDKFITSGAVQCYFPMMLYFIQQVLGEQFADDVASWLAIPKSRESQLSFMACHAFELHQDRKLLALQHYIKQSLSDDLTLPVLADRLCVSERTLIRRFNKHVGLSPSAYVRLARLERAKQLLRSTEHRFDAIGELVGYQDLSALNKQFKAQYGQSMKQWTASERE